MKQKIKRLICRILGHVELEEVYAVKLAYSDARNPLYNIVRDTVCLRCGKVLHREKLAYSLTREEMLRKKWFITDDKTTRQ